MDDEGLADAVTANPFSFPQTSPRNWFSWWVMGALRTPGPAAGPAAVLRQAALSRRTGSERQRDDEIGEARQLIESLDEFLHASDGAAAEHHTRQPSKLRPNFVFSIGLLEVAACALSQPCDLTPIGERDGHPVLA